MKDGLDRQGLHRILIYTVDTDVVVLAISAVAKLNHLNLSIAFGSGTHFRYLNVNNLASSISHDKANVLPMFYAIAGCDTVSFFAGKGENVSKGYMVCVHRFYRSTFSPSCKPSCST